MPPPLRGELRGGSDGTSQEYQRFIFLSHQAVGGKMHQSGRGLRKAPAESSCRAGAAAGAALAGAAKPAMRRATREMRTTDFMERTPVSKGCCEQFILPFHRFATTAFFAAPIDSSLNKTC